jgi:hypothetical protein
MPLASLHLTTLGVLTTAAIGASLQLLPVATRRPVASTWVPAAIFVVIVAAIVALVAGMASAVTMLLATGAIGVGCALVVYTVLLAWNLAGAKGMPVVVAHGWAALTSLLVALATGAALGLSYVMPLPVDRVAAISLHVTFAVYGFMGMLAMGVSYILLPMFALAPPPNDRIAAASAALAVGALAFASLAALGVASRELRVVAVAAGAAAFALHVRLMGIALRTGLRRSLGKPMVLVRAGWASIGASLAAALALALDVPFERLPALFGTLSIGGLLTFLLGILARIVPFLASMHAAGGPRPPTPSALTDERALGVHTALHIAALGFLVAAVAADSATLVRLAAALGTAGAVAFAAFFATAWRRSVAARLAAASAGALRQIK